MGAHGREHPAPGRPGNGVSQQVSLQPQGWVLGSNYPAGAIPLGLRPTSGTPTPGLISPFASWELRWPQRAGHLGLGPDTAPTVCWAPCTVIPACPTTTQLGRHEEAHLTGEETEAPSRGVFI